LQAISIAASDFGAFDENVFDCRRCGAWSNGCAGGGHCRAALHQGAAAFPAYNWTGYAGVNAGYAWEDPTVNYTPNNAVISGGGNVRPVGSWDNSGALGGFQIGYNWQFSPQWVAGIEADINASDIKGSNTSAGMLGFATAQFTTGQKVDWFGTVRGRLGFLPTDRLLVYGTGGLAYGEVKENTSITTIGAGTNVTNGGFGVSCVANQTCFAGSASGVRTGWTAGVGVEYAIWQNLTAKAEYLYVDLGGNSIVGTAFNGTACCQHPIPRAFRDLASISCAAA
jgi:outer membrane immunogenic protein